MTDAVEIAAKAMAEAMNGGTWEDQKWYSEQHKERWSEAMRAALTAVLDAVTLEWEERSEGWDADTPVGGYILRGYGNVYAWASGHTSGKAKTLAAAQTAALADYRARLAKALGFTPASADRASDPAP